MSVWMSKLIEKYSEINEKKLDPVGQEDGDIDNDGDKDSTDKYLMKRRKAIKKSMQKEAEDKTTPCPNCEGSMENHSPDCKSSKESKTKDDTAVVNPKQEKTQSEDVQEIARSMTPMRNKFGKSKAEKGADAMKKAGNAKADAEADERKKNAGKPFMKKENTQWPIYKRIMEKRDEHYKSATKTQAMDDNMAPDAKEFVDAHTKGDNKEADKVDINVAIQKNITGMANPVKSQAKLRPGDNNQGDKVADKPEGKLQ